MRAGPRVYGGRSAEERQAERRRRLVEAALEVWGDEGWAAVTMRGVCARAGLVDRYFYENFADRDALLAAVWDQLRAEVVQILVEAIADKTQEHPLTQLRAAIAAFVHRVAEDPRRARIAFGEHAGSPALEQRRHDSLQEFADLLIMVGRPYLKTGVDETQLRMTTLLGIGGFVELITAWHVGLIDATAEEVIKHATQVGTLLGEQYLVHTRKRRSG